MNKILLYLLMTSPLLQLPNVAFTQENKHSKEDTIYFTGPDTLFVEKQKCKCEVEGHTLLIRESKIFGVDDTCSPFNYGTLFYSDYSKRIGVIKKLLEYRNDTSLSCISIRSYSLDIYENHGNEFSTIPLTIRVMALYHINLISFGQFSVYKYSPYPVLYDTVEKKIINDDVEKIEEVFAIYEAWFVQNEKTNFKNYSFPLLNTRYKWIYGESSKRMVFETFPIIKGDYGQRIGQPVNEELYRNKYLLNRKKTGNKPEKIK